MRPPLDRDFVRTREDLIFCVVGYLHPEDRITAYLKYMPSSEGKWSDGEKRFTRILPYYHARMVSETIDFLKGTYPPYVSFDPVRNIEMSMVPRDHISRYYMPEERMGEIFERQNDALEKDVFDFVLFLCSETGLRKSDFGVTGSILTYMHNPSFSDMDILVYGLSPSQKLRRAFGELHHPHLQKKDEKEKKRWVENRSSHFPISRRLAAYYFERKWNFGYFDNRYFSIHPVRRPEEMKEKYGERLYRQLGKTRVRARISEAQESIFLPAVYKISDVVILEGKEKEISEVVSFEGLYCDVADEGDVVDVCGMLEHSDDEFSVVVGTRNHNEEWIRVIPHG